LSIREDGLVSQGSLPAGASVNARQSDDKNAIEITISGVTAGQEFTLHLTLKTANEGRLLAEQDLRIACVSFETRLSALTVSHGTALSFNQDTFLYDINTVLVSRVTITPTPINPSATVNIAGDLGVGRVDLDMGTNTVTVRVSAAHGATAGEYALRITRVQLPDTKNISAFSLAGVQVSTINQPNVGVINEAAGTIGIILPWGTDLTGLTPEVAWAGASYAPTGPQNFSSPVTYTVTAVDISTKPYVVTVILSPISSIAVTAGPSTATYPESTTVPSDAELKAGVVIKGTDSADHTGIDITDECTFSPSGDFNVAGEKTITVTHTPSGQTATFTVMVAKILTGSVSITGTAKVSHTLTANTASLNGTTGTFEYAWYRKNAPGEAISGSNKIEGASAGTYELTSADEDKFMTLVVTRTGYTGSSQAPTTAVVAGYSVGDTGPGGGTIYYKPGTYSGGWRYLEVSPNDLHSGRGWTLANSDCTGYGGGGKNDWNLPTRDQLLKLYTAKTEGLISISNFSLNWYWTSEKFSNGYYYVGYIIGDGHYPTNLQQSDLLPVRAVRQF
jgi:hypothetical protein